MISDASFHFPIFQISYWIKATKLLNHFTSLIQMLSRKYDAFVGRFASVGYVNLCHYIITIVCYKFRHNFNIIIIAVNINAKSKYVKSIFMSSNLWFTLKFRIAMWCYNNVCKNCSDISAKFTVEKGELTAHNNILNFCFYLTYWSLVKRLNFMRLL